MARQKTKPVGERPLLWSLPVAFAGLASVLLLYNLPSDGARSCHNDHNELPPEVAVAAGTYRMGAAGLHPEEGSPRTVAVKAFYIDTTEVTNRQFAEFVAATGYVTLSERPADPAHYPGVAETLLQPSSLVFVGSGTAGLNEPWQVVAGANWRQPEGPNSSIAERMQHPVVHIGYEDALAYARWRGRDLPTEAEWEYAARGGLDGARYEWGDEMPDHEAPRANYWQGVFPRSDTGADGFVAATAPVACFEANGYGLYDMSGNVWEWTRTLSDEHFAVGQLQQHLIKGGSFLCADNYCHRYRPAARQLGPPDTGASHIGFRTVRREQDAR